MQLTRRSSLLPKGEEELLDFESACLGGGDSFFGSDAGFFSPEGLGCDVDSSFGFESSFLGSGVEEVG